MLPQVCVTLRNFKCLEEFHKRVDNVVKQHIFFGGSLLQLTVRFTGMSMVLIGHWEEQFLLDDQCQTVARLVEAIQQKHGEKLGKTLDACICVIHRGKHSTSVYPDKRDHLLKEGDLVTFVSPFAGG